MKIHPNDPIHPIQNWSQNDIAGLTKREYFAAKAVNLVNSNINVIKKAIRA
jgi:hypothetical protein